MFTAFVLAACQMAGEIRFEEYLQTLPPDEAQAMRAQRAANAEKARLEADVERRHRELVDAIKHRRHWEY